MTPITANLKNAGRKDKRKFNENIFVFFKNIFRLVVKKHGRGSIRFELKED